MLKKYYPLIIQMYNTFENINCINVNDIETDKNRQNNLIFNNQIFLNEQNCPDKDKDITDENTLMFKQFEVNGSCAKKPLPNNENNDCIGYDCLPNSFLFDPDKFNTYQNYLVLQDELHNGRELYCSENHQIFRNWTKRKNGFMLDTKTTTDTNFDEYYRKIPELRYNQCLHAPKENYQC